MVGEVQANLGGQVASNLRTQDAADHDVPARRLGDCGGYIPVAPLTLARSGNRHNGLRIGLGKEGGSQLNKG
jgi:hypothetical protein